jgi:hypothetical protein
MGGLIPVVMLAALLALAPTCQQSPREEGGSLVIDRVLQELQRLDIPVAASNPEEGWIETAPVLREALPGGPYVRVEEQYRLELKCRDPLTTRISGRPQVTGIRGDQSRSVLTDGWPYWERLLKNLRIK